MATALSLNACPYLATSTPLKPPYFEFYSWDNNSDAGEEVAILHVYDVVEGARAAISILEEGMHRKYALTPNLNLTIRELVSLLEKALNMTLNVEWGVLPSLQRRVDTPPKLRKLSNWTASYEFPEGLGMVIGLNDFG